MPADRVALMDALQRVKGHVSIAEWFLTNEKDEMKVGLELLGRANLIEAKVAEIRNLLAGEEKRSPEPSRNLHVLGNRPPTDAA